MIKKRQTVRVRKDGRQNERRNCSASAGDHVLLSATEHAAPMMLCKLVFGSMEHDHLQHYSELQIHVILITSRTSERTPNEHHAMSAIKVQRCRSLVWRRKH